MRQRGWRRRLRKNTRLTVAVDTPAKMQSGRVGGGSRTYTRMYTHGKRSTHQHLLMELPAQETHPHCGTSRLSSCVWCAVRHNKLMGRRLWVPLAPTPPPQPRAASSRTSFLSPALHFSVTFKSGVVQARHREHAPVRVHVCVCG